MVEPECKSRSSEPKALKGLKGHPVLPRANMFYAFWGSGLCLEEGVNIELDPRHALDLPEDLKGS